MTKSLEVDYPFHCPTLYNSITTYPNGTYTPCCYAQQRDAPTNVSYDQYWDSDYRKDMIAKFDKGEWPDACIRCSTIEKSDGWSKRKMEWHKHMMHHNDTDIKKFDKKLATIDLRLSNLCNQACVFCNSVNSSKIEDEVIEHGDKHTENIYHNYEMWKSQNFRSSWELDEIKSLLTNYEIDDKQCRMYMTGGEPTLLKINLEILEFIVDNNMQDKFYLDINTNHQSWNYKFFALANKFNGRCMSSIDATNSTIDYIRYHSNWDNTLNNILRFHKEFPHWKKSIHPAMFILNITQLPEMLEWSHKHDINIGVYNILAKPNWLDMRLLPESIRLDIADKLEEIKIKYYNWNFSDVQKEKNWDQDTQIGITNIQNILRKGGELIKNNSTGDLWTLQDTALQLDRIDKIRNINWRETFPWLAELIKETHNV